ncbi:MAG: hypothetical protein ACXV0U_12890 [Kineosporiaceae bacterium]
MRPARLPPTLADEPPPLVARLRSLAALGARHRRLVAAVCAGSAVLVTVSTLMPSTPSATAGTSWRGGASAASGALPVGAGASAPDDAFQVAVAVRLADPAGLLLLRAGGHAQVLASPSETGVPVAGGEAASAGGSTAGAAAQGEVLARDAVVLGVPGADGGAGDVPPGGHGGLLGDVPGSSLGAAGGQLEGVVLLAVTPTDARRLAAAGGRALSVAVALPAQSHAPPG